MKATEDERKRSPARRRLFGPVDHNQNKVDASLIWTNVNPGFPRVDYSPRFRPRPMDDDRFTDGCRGAEVEDDVKTEGGGVQTGSSVELKVYGKGEPDQAWSTRGLVLSAGDLHASSNPTRSWNQNPGWAGTNLRPSSGSPTSPTESSDRSSGRRRRTVSERQSTNNFTEETDLIAGSSYSPTSLDPSSRIRPSTCPWRTLARVDRGFYDEGRMRSASLGQVSRPICARHRSCRNSTVEDPESSLNFDPTLEPAYKKVPVVQLQGGDRSTVLSPPGQSCFFFKPIGKGDESPAVTASQSTEESRDAGSSLGTRGSVVYSRLQETGSSAENVRIADDESGLREDVFGVDECGMVTEAADDEHCPVSRASSVRRRRQSDDQTEDSSRGREEKRLTGHDCIEEEEEEEDVEGRADVQRDISGGRIKDKLVTKPPRAKRRKPYKDGNSNSPS